MPTLQSPPTPSKIWHCPECTYANWGGPLCDLCGTAHPRRPAQFLSQAEPPPPPVINITVDQRAAMQDPSAVPAASHRSSGKLARASAKRAQERALLLSTIGKDLPPPPADTSMSKRHAVGRALLLLQLPRLSLALRDTRFVAPRGIKLAMSMLQRQLASLL